MSGLISRGPVKQNKNDVHFVSTCVCKKFDEFIKPERCQSMLDQWETGYKWIDIRLYLITSAPSCLGPKK